jgi:hypothetical protein
MSQDKEIGVLSIHLKDAKIIKTKDKNFSTQALQTVKNAMILFVPSSMYSFRDIFDGKESSTYIYYNDPFTNNFSLDTFSSDSSEAYENTETNPGIGWQGNNKTLLSFSAGKSV